MKKGGTTAIALVVLVIGVLGAVLLYSGTSSITGAVPANKIDVCHCPPGHFDPDTNQCDVIREPIRISQNAFPAHQAHGDHVAFTDPNTGQPTCIPPDGEPSCGDGVITAPEVCDEGPVSGDIADDVGCNNAGGYGCNDDCASCESCGDNKINDNEECDGNDLPAGCTQCMPTCVCQTCDHIGADCTWNSPAVVPKLCPAGFLCHRQDPPVIVGNGDDCGICIPTSTTTTTVTVTTTTTASTTTTTLGCQLGTDECAPAGSVGPGNGCAPGVTCTSACICTTATTSTTTTQPPSTTSTTMGGGEGGF